MLRALVLSATCFVPCSVRRAGSRAPSTRHQHRALGRHL